MIRMRYGTQGQVSFCDMNEYYYALGFLANSKNAELRWENNEDQGAWGSEGRIHCLVPKSQFPPFFKFTAGRGNVYARINCNDYVGTLVTEHHFNYNSHTQDVSKILETVPAKYKEIFKNGYDGNIDVIAVYNAPTRSTERRSTSPQPRSAADQAVAISPAPASVVIPKPQPIPISIGDRISHKNLGTGTVYDIEGSYIRIHFETYGDKRFKNPDAFNNGFLSKI